MQDILEQYSLSLYRAVLRGKVWQNGLPLNEEAAASMLLHFGTYTFLSLGRAPSPRLRRRLSLLLHCDSTPIREAAQKIHHLAGLEAYDGNP